MFSHLTTWDPYLFSEPKMGRPPVFFSLTLPKTGHPPSKEEPTKIVPSVSGRGVNNGFSVSPFVAPPIPI